MYHLFRISGNAMRTQTQQMAIQLFIIGSNSTTFSRSHRFHRMKTKAGHIRQTSHRLSLIGCPNGMRRILDQEQVMLLADLSDLIQFHSLSGEIHCDNRLGPWGDQLPNGCRINIISLRVNIRKDRLCTGI